MKKLLAFLLFGIISQWLSAQTDTLPPTLVCKPQQNLSQSFHCSKSIWVFQLIDTVFDDSNASFELGVRRQCTETGFPGNKYFTFATLGTNVYEIWARDSFGNTSMCTTSVVLDDPGNCSAHHSVTVVTPENVFLPKTRIVLESRNCQQDTIRKEALTDELGTYWGTGELARAGNQTDITPSRKINVTNGLTTYDLVLIQKHILGIQPLGSPYKLIAADANYDGAVTTADVVLLRKLLLGIIQELPSQQSWRFVPSQYVFPNPANPFAPPIPEKHAISETTFPVPNHVWFIGVKIGDVNASASPEN